MAGFNFGIIGEYVEAFMDTDSIDIGRSEIITLPDGSSTVTDPKIPKYKNVPCHVSFSTIDNPDPTTVGSIPIIRNVTINCKTVIDLQNGDLIHARKLDTNGNILEEYEGTIGAPATNQSRKEANMAIRQAI